ncbi:MAG: EF-Tu/IF-2/RF-3 family GTPase [Candidatus Marsarchaeota archaeon]|nr:EF-Tu/IF-2/RF-3 family GTPase [Candidatus Marsarchaeota archaeon]
MDYVVAVLNSPELAGLLGKEGSKNGITLYNRIYSGNTIVIASPTDIEAKFHAVAQSLLIADTSIVSTEIVDKHLGEILIACSLVNRNILITDENDVSTLLSSISISGKKMISKDNALDEILKCGGADMKATGKGFRIDVDKSFDVKGIGAVCLGIVRYGTVKVHDKVYSGDGKEGIVRSLQSQDRDIDSAGKGVRVGIALKGIASEQIAKGDVLSDRAFQKTKRLAIGVKLSDINREDMAIGKKYLIAFGFDYINGTLTEFDGKSASFELDREASFEKEDEVLLIRTAMPRIFGSGIVL